jgi:hypothetical protein
LAFMSMQHWQTHIRAWFCFMLRSYPTSVFPF